MGEKEPEGKPGEVEENDVISDKSEQGAAYPGDAKVVGGYLTDYVCTICGARLRPCPPSTVLNCYFCGKEKEARIRCWKGHYICPECWPKHGNYIKIVGDRMDAVFKGKVIYSTRLRKS